MKHIFKTSRLARLILVLVGALAIGTQTAAAQIVPPPIRIVVDAPG